MALYSTFLYGEEVYSSAGGLSTTQVLQERVPWVFQAMNSGDSYEFAINPLEATMPQITKTFNTPTTADGSNLLFQGRDKIPTMSFSGTILTEDHLNMMRAWHSIQKQVSITDDLGYKYWVYLKSFSPTRQHTIEFPWHHEFSSEAVVLDWA